MYVREQTYKRLTDLLHGEYITFSEWKTMSMALRGTTSEQAKTEVRVLWLWTDAQRAN